MLLGTSLFASGVPVLLLAYLVAISQTLGPINQGGPVTLAVAAGVFGLPLAWGLFLAHLVRRVLPQRVFALTPAQCWTVARKEKADEKPPQETFIGDEVDASRGGGWGVSQERRARSQH
jgi:hypothetical protein